MWCTMKMFGRELGWCSALSLGCVCVAILVIDSFSRSMITIQDLSNIPGNKISNEMQKAIVRNNCPAQIAEQMCVAIDGQEKAGHFQRLLQEYNEWLIYQQKQPAMVQGF